MQTRKKVTTLFLDIGGVLLTNGWEHESRRLAAKKFGLDEAETEARHQLTFNTYELGKLSFEEYLDRTVFYRKRSFTKNEFRKFMFAQSKAFPEMIRLITELKNRHSLKVAVVNNEARELNAYRIKKFKLKNFVDFFISSCFVHFRKPDADIFRMALDIAQVEPDEVVYIEDRPMFVSIAESLGIRGIRHVDYKKTLRKLEMLGLKV